MSEYKFGELVKAKLIELKMSRNELAKRVHKARSYINYVVSGKNKTARAARAAVPEARAEVKATISLPKFKFAKRRMSEKDDRLFLQKFPDI